MKSCSRSLFYAVALLAGFVAVPAFAATGGVTATGDNIPFSVNGGTNNVLTLQSNSSSGTVATFPGAVIIQGTDNSGTGLTAGSVATTNALRDLAACSAGQALTKDDTDHFACTSVSTAVPPTCTGSNMLQFDGTNFTCVAAPSGGGGGACAAAASLVNGGHTCGQCTSAGGTPYQISSGQYICRFASSNPPSGWTRYQNWSTTSPGYGDGRWYKGSTYEDSWIRCAESTNGYPPTCMTGSHAFSNVAVETCGYTISDIYNNGGDTYCLASGTSTASASRQEVGAY